LPQFRADATNALNALLSRAPFSAYRPWINASAIAVASTQSGSDHPAYGTSRQTYFNSSYDASADYIITIPPNAFDSNYANGQGKIDALLSSLMPRCQLPVLLVNDLVSGGSDGGGGTAIVSRGAAMLDFLAHETGHVAAGLGDEYTAANPGYPDTEEPNTTRSTNNIKWAAWIPAGTPLPTPPTGAYESVVGLFEGAHYHTTGWYRPKLNCTMNSPSFPEYCEICRESLLLAIYRAARPVDSHLPAAPNLVLADGHDVSLSVQLVQPAALAVQWFTNSVPISGGTNSSCIVSVLSLGNGSHTVTALVRDLTLWVRSDPTGLLTQTVAWNLQVTIPQLRLEFPQLLPDGSFSMRLTGPTGADVIVQSNTNLASVGSWTAISTNRLVDGIAWYTNSPSPSSTRRFYRTLLAP
jgi:hypothetical protein